MNRVLEVVGAVGDPVGEPDDLTFRGRWGGPAACGVGAPTRNAVESPVSSQNGKQADKKLAILRNSLEPMLQRELEHRGLDKVNHGFEARLIAWVEAIG